MAGAGAASVDTSVVPSLGALTGGYVNDDELQSRSAVTLGGDKDVVAALEHMDSVISSSSSKNLTASASTDLNTKFAALRQAVQASAIVSKGFGALSRTYENEGSDALLFFSVPNWISFAKISGCRYRQVTNVVDGAVDEFEEAQQGVTFFGFPGASGWADKIGDVAVHYLHAEWAVFSKVFPFNEQVLSREQHEDMLLLGSTNHVMLTPGCVRSIGPSGIRGTDTMVTLLNSEGSIADERTCSAANLPKGVAHRLWLTWGHKEGHFASEVAHFERPLSELLDEVEPWSKKAKRFFLNLVSVRMKVAERWIRYPGAPLDPSYYQQMLATVVNMSPAEEVARLLMVPLPGDEAATGSEDAQPAQAEGTSGEGYVRIDVPAPEDVTA